MNRKVITEGSVIILLSYLGFGLVRLVHVGAGKADGLTYMPLIDGPWRLFINLIN